MEVTHPARFALQHEFCSPAIGNSFFLRSGKSIDVCSVLRDEDEVAQVAHDEVRFVVRPDGVFEGPYSRLWRKDSYIVGGKRDGAEVSAGVHVRGIEGGGGACGAQRGIQRGETGRAGERAGRAEAIAIRRQFRTDDYGQEPAGESRYSRSQRQQLLSGGEPGGPQGVPGEIPAELAAGEALAVSGAGGSVPGGDAGRQGAARTRLAVPEESQRVSGEGARRGRSGAGEGDCGADSLLPDGRSGGLDPVRNCVGAEQWAGGFRQWLYRGLPGRARGQGHVAEFRLRHGREDEPVDAQAGGERAVFRRSRSLGAAVQEAGCEGGDGEGMRDADRDGGFSRRHGGGQSPQ